MVDFPAIFGHEGAGYIKAVGSGVKDKSLQVGDAVLLSFNVCGECQQCVSGHPAFCHIHPQVNHNAVRLEDRSTPARLKDSPSTTVRSQYFGHSSFARHSVVKERSVVKCAYPDQMELYAAMGCGFQTGAGTVLNVLKPPQSSSIVIFGLGGVGISALMAAKYLGVQQIVGVDLVDSKLKLARDLGATDLLRPSTDTDVVKEIKKICKATCGATYSIDCTGVPKVIEQCIECLAPCGTAVTVGVPPSDAKISIDPLNFLLENKRYIGVIEGDSVPAEFIPRLLELHQDGKFPVEKLCKVFPVERMGAALREMHAGTAIKAVLQWF
jgi:Zn-dependent alcohol dehydrogenase